jgi:hypothetical protein
MRSHLVRALAITILEYARADALGHRLPWYLALSGRGGRA